MSIKLDTIENGYRAIDSDRVLEFTVASSGRMDYPSAVDFAQAQSGILVNAEQLAFARNALQGQDIVRERAWSGTLVAYSLDQGGVFRAFEPDQGTLETISRVGFEAHEQDTELIYDLRSETEDPVVLAIKTAWNESAHRQVALASRNRVEKNLRGEGSSEFETYDAIRAIVQGGASYLAEDLRNTDLAKGSFFHLLPAELSHCLEPGDGRVLIRPVGFTPGMAHVDAVSPWGSERYARAVINTQDL